MTAVTLLMMMVVVVPGWWVMVVGVMYGMGVGRRREAASDVRRIVAKPIVTV